MEYRFEKVQQAAGEFAFPSFFGLIPWMHHVLIITKCKSIEEALFYIKKTIADNLSSSSFFYLYLGISYFGEIIGENGGDNGLPYILFGNLFGNLSSNDLGNRL